jgi:hypothetical protein
VSNLGKYQDLTTLAKDAGGVDNYMKSIELDAVIDAAPKLIIPSLVIGAALAWGVKALIEKRDTIRAAAQNAKDQVRATVAQTATPDEPVVAETASGDRREGSEPEEG